MLWSHGFGCVSATETWFLSNKLIPQSFVSIGCCGTFSALANFCFGPAPVTTTMGVSRARFSMFVLMRIYYLFSVRKIFWIQMKRFGAVAHAMSLASLSGAISNDFWLWSERERASPFKCNNSPSSAKFVEFFYRVFESSLLFVFWSRVREQNEIQHKRITMTWYQPPPPWIPFTKLIWLNKFETVYCFNSMKMVLGACSPYYSFNFCFFWPHHVVNMLVCM